MSASSSLLSRGLGLVLVEFEYQYQDRDGVPVSIKPHERYVLVAKTNDHWWQVRADGGSRTFYIPAKYVKELPLDLPSPLDFTDDGTGPGPVPVPVVAPVPVPVPVVAPVPVPVPKPLEEPNGNQTRTKAGDEVKIRFRPENSGTRYRKNENRMSTFGVPLDWTQLAGPVDTVTAATTTVTASTSLEDVRKPAPLPGLDHIVPSFSPADPRLGSRSQNQPIPVETPVVPSDLHPVPSDLHPVPSDLHPVPSDLHPVPSDLHPGPSRDQLHPGDQLHRRGSKDLLVPHEDQLRPGTPSPPEEERRDKEKEDRKEKEKERRKEEDSNHIYESILDLGLEGLVGGPRSPGRQSPGQEPESKTAAPTPPNAQDGSSPIYANVSSVRKPPPQISGPDPPSPPDPPLRDPGPPLRDPGPPLNAPDLQSPDLQSPDLQSPDLRPSPSSSSSSMMSPQDGWQVHTDQGSGKLFYYHAVTGQTTWSSPTSPSTGDPEPGTSSTSSQGSSWEQLLDQVSGRVYYYNPQTGATAWERPDPPEPPGREPPLSPPPLPAEDYPVHGVGNHDDAVFTTVRAEQDPSSRQESMMGNGVSDEEAGPQVKNWRHSLVEEIVTSGLRRVASDLSDGKKPSSPQLSDRFRLRRNLSNQSSGPAPRHHSFHLLEKAGIINKTKVVDNGKRIRKNWSQSWTVLHGGILTFHRDPKSTPAGNPTKASHIVPEFTVDLRGASLDWAGRDKSSKKNVLELKTRQGCEYLMQYDTDSIICDWMKVLKDAIGQLEQDHLSEDEDSDREDKDRKRTSTRSSSGSDSEQRRVRTKLRRFLQRRPTLQSVKEKGYIRDNVFGCHLDTLCHRENNNIPRFVEKCIRTVERRGLDVDGIYRVSGNLAVIQRLRHKADHEEDLDLEDGQWEEIHVVTGALKLFFRELPEPLFPFSAFDKFIAAVQVPDQTLRVSYMKDLVRSLPLPNYRTMELLFRHLNRVVEHRDQNRMSVQSLAIVFGPTLLGPETESNMTVHMVFQSQIVELMLLHFQTVFSEP
ncbi:rho GTPase-activating protein 27-like isoform X2 [Cololabis saira]|uniref:rho GTPase-activating protein 27-like isoform X2 n=1 Tax=Cololabis saira TaxID=129043 RepID=UPI002AD1E72E|nr:rho GTPase-activating protein 27-like isoform X2 [Cololabis saira]